MVAKNPTGDRLFNRALLFSACIHAVFLLLLPGMKLMEPLELTEWLEVDLVEPLDLDFPAEKAESGLDEDPEGDQEQEVFGESPLLPNPPVWLPDRLNTTETESVPMRLALPTDLLPEVAGSGSSAPGLILTGEEAEGEAPLVAMFGTNPPKVKWKPSLPVADSEPDQESSDLQISGEVANRKVLFRPPAPRPTTSASGTILIKFWVQTDGTISKIMPITRGDTALEQVAIDYLEKWRFEPVKPEIGLQSGTIPIRFRIR